MPKCAVCHRNGTYREARRLQKNGSKINNPSFRHNKQEKEQAIKTKESRREEIMKIKVGFLQNNGNLNDVNRKRINIFKIPFQPKSIKVE